MGPEGPARTAELERHVGASARGRGTLVRPEALTAGKVRLARWALPRGRLTALALHVCAPVPSAKHGRMPGKRRTGQTCAFRCARTPQGRGNGLRGACWLPHMSTPRGDARGHRELGVALHGRGAHLPAQSEISAPAVGLENFVNKRGRVGLDRKVPKTLSLALATERGPRVFVCAQHHTEIRAVPPSPTSEPTRARCVPSATPACSACGRERSLSFTLVAAHHRKLGDPPVSTDTRSLCPLLRRAANLPRPLLSSPTLPRSLLFVYRVLEAHSGRRVFSPVLRHNGDFQLSVWEAISSPVFLASPTLPRSL